MANISVILTEELSTSLETMNWKLCFICQQIRKNDLKDPITKKGKFSLLHKQILDFCFGICVKSLIIWSFQSRSQWLYQSHISKYCIILMWMFNNSRIVEKFLCMHQNKLNFCGSYLYEVLFTYCKVWASSLHEKLNSPNPYFPQLYLIIDNQTMIWDPLLL